MVDLVPTMTSNTTPAPYVISMSDLYGAYDAYYAFDDVGTTFLHTGPTCPHWVKVDFGVGSNIAVNGYSLRSRDGNVGQAPYDWTFEGSNNDADWSVLNSQSAQTFESGVVKEYYFSNVTSYRYYRLYVTNTPAGYMSISEMQHSGGAGAVAVSHLMMVGVG